MSACHVELQYWKRWPKILVMRDDNGNERRYIPEPPCETDETGLVTRLSLDGFWYALEETCHNAWPMSDRDERPAMFVCSECNTWVGKRVYCHPVDPSGEKYLVLDCNVKYCPNCGAKVERVTDS